MPVIRVSGHLGAGKTTLCRELSERLNYPYLYTGNVFRELAKEKGLSIEELFAAMACEPEVEKEIDGRQKRFMNEHRDCIVEGRMAPFLHCKFPTVNILLTVEENAGARRQCRARPDENLTFEEMKKRTRERLLEERARYKKLYGIEDHFAEKHFDIVLDTTNLSPTEVLGEILLGLLGISISRR